MFATSSLALSLLLGVAQAVPAVPVGSSPRAEVAKIEARWGDATHSPRDVSNNPGGQTYDLPLEWNPFGFLSKIGIGSTNFQMPIFVDWTWIGQIVTTPRCYGSYNPTACLDAKQIQWDPRTSQSFVNQSTVYADRSWNPNHFFFTFPMNIDYGTDSLHVGPVSGETTLQLTDLIFKQDNLGGAFPFTGIFGLSPVFKGDNKDYQSPFYQQWLEGKWKEGRVGFVYCYDAAKKKNICKGADGLQTLGGVRSDLIKDEKIWWYDVGMYPDVNHLDFMYDPPMYNYWGIELASLTIGNESQKIVPTSDISGKGAIFDHASYGRGIPLTLNAYGRLVTMTQAKPLKPKTLPNNGPQSFYSVDCGAVASFPEVKYTFVGHSREWVVKPQHYVDTIDNGTCTLNVRALASGDRFLGNFGETFAKDKYISLDFEQNRVGISDLKGAKSCKRK